ncbi:hypothetical protein Q5530_29145 [Saccharothrix sp. BKS2]|uniref:hypothetical protein n=1 Tax=Saccharothrix sp. BKS2 TaxID=3064400 RepID=UPI0039EA30AA
MIGRKVRLALAGGLAVAALVGGSGAAQADSGGERAGVERASGEVAVAAVWRGGYYNYYDCDLAGFQGIYHGWWTGYICSYRAGSSPAIWDLYA